MSKDTNWWANLYTSKLPRSNGVLVPIYTKRASYLDECYAKVELGLNLKLSWMWQDIWRHRYNFIYFEITFLESVLPQSWVRTQIWSYLESDKTFEGTDTFLFTSKLPRRRFGYQVLRYPELAGYLEYIVYLALMLPQSWVWIQIWSHHKCDG